ncbi:hypothetical protein [Pusillimonas noertemannii]|uniref:Uncharacterized protein n=1 Tax=Pusillimonas noertemannii TaxID=305977 RepID=A0A2U1CNY1_9BURK|nr:hypothetical protein [Pusillimonas noertemannii]NYT68265.1 hypothetical protein [Pusillimonas noertemannii]PVY62720.1 hypothetical protein C7440_2216 [Pusillimonas noertemannii]TFL10344.1 hypothetical protein CSC72_07325 [Pusillimonas noertemannii]
MNSEIEDSSATGDSAEREKALERITQRIAAIDALVETQKLMDEGRHDEASSLLKTIPDFSDEP